MSHILVLLCMAGLAAIPMLIGQKMKFGPSLLLMNCGLFALYGVLSPLEGLVPKLSMYITAAAGVVGAAGFLLELFGIFSNWRCLRENFFTPGLIVFILCGVASVLLKETPSGAGLLTLPEAGIFRLTGTELSLLLPVSAVALAALTDLLPIPGNGFVLVLLLGVFAFFGGEKLISVTMMDCLVWFAGAALFRKEEKSTGEGLALYLSAAFLALRGNALPVFLASLLLILAACREKIWLCIVAVFASLLFIAAWLLNRFGTPQDTLLWLKGIFSGADERIPLLEGEGWNIICTALKTTLLWSLPVLIVSLAAGFLVSQEERGSMAGGLLLGAAPVLLCLLMMPFKVLLFAELPQEDLVKAPLVAFFCAGLYEMLRIMEWNNRRLWSLLLAALLSGAACALCVAERKGWELFSFLPELTAATETPAVAETTPGLSRTSTLPALPLTPSPTPVVTAEPTASPVPTLTPEPTAAGADRLLLSPTAMPQNSTDAPALPTMEPEIVPTLPSVTQMPRMTNG